MAFQCSIMRLSELTSVRFNMVSIDLRLVQ